MMMRTACVDRITGGFSTKNEHIRSTLKKVLRETEKEYKVSARMAAAATIVVVMCGGSRFCVLMMGQDLEFIYPHIPFAKAAFYAQLNAEPTDELSDIGYNVRQ
jgi:hypothetical protein